MSDRRYRRLGHRFIPHGHKTYHLSLLNANSPGARQLSTPLLGDRPVVETLTLFAAVGGSQRMSLDAITSRVDQQTTTNDPPLDDALVEIAWPGQPYGKWPQDTHVIDATTLRVQAPTNKSPAAVRAIVEQFISRRLFATITTRDRIDSLDGTVPAAAAAFAAFQPAYTPAASAIGPPAQLFGWWAYRPYSISPRRHAWGWRPAGEPYEPPGSTRRYGTRTQAASWPSPSA